MKRARDYYDIREEAEHYRPPFSPDLSEVYAEEREIVMFEIEDRSPVTSERKRLIEYWQGITMDGWDWWDVLVITTNRFGLGWDTQIDTKAEGQKLALARLHTERDEHIKYWPHLDTDEAIKEFYAWRNWQMPESKDFAEIRNRLTFM